MKLASAQEWHRMLEFPSYYRIPLIQAKGEISMTSNPFGIIRIHHCFRGRTDRYPLFQWIFASMCDPCYLGRKTLDMCLLSLEDLF